MKRALKWLGIVLGALVLIVVAAIVILPSIIDVEKYKPMLESKGAEITGRPFSVGGDVKLSVFPWLGVSFTDVKLGSPEGFAEKEFVSVRSLNAKAKLIPLLSKNLQLTAVIEEPNIVLVKNKDGRVNWSFEKKAQTEKVEKKEPAGKPELPFSSVYIGEFAIKNGSAQLIDRTTGGHHKIENINLALTDVSLEKPIKLTLDAVFDDKPLSVKGSIGPVGKTIGQQPVGLDVALDALKELKMTLKGMIENPLQNPTAKLAVVVPEFSPRRLMEALGKAFPVKTADPEALGSVALKADVTASAKSVSVANGKMDLDGSKLAFNLKASEFSRPNVSFDMNLDQIDLDRYLPPAGDKPAATGKKPAASKKGEDESRPAPKPDYKPLRKLILDGTVNIGSLKVKKANISSVLLKIRAKDGVINLDPMKMVLYGGSFNGNTVVDVRSDTPATNLALNVQGVQVNPLMIDVMSKDILEGTTQAQINLRMTGAEANAIKRTLNGKGQLTFNDGAIKGYDLAAMARNAKVALGLEKKADQRPKTDFSELSVPFTINSGRFNTPMTLLKSPLIRLEAKGDAHLVEETLDFRVEPKVVGTLKGQGDERQRSGLLVPIIVSGTFSAPTFVPDVEALAKQHLDVDRKELEAKAREEVEQKASGALGDKAGVVKGLLGEDKAAGEAPSDKEGEKKPEDQAKDLIKGFLKSD